MSAEPSMEEILSSIKRIIAEEGEGPVRARRGGRGPLAPPPPSPAPVLDDDDEGEVLELSDPIPPSLLPEASPPRVSAPADIRPAAPEPAEEPLAMADPVDTPVRPRNAPAATPPNGPEPEAVQPIVSDRAAEASRSSLESLSRLMVRADAPAADDNTLEGLVRAMLRPMLREWLDANLPAMVETMVAAEIKRITGQPR